MKTLFLSNDKKISGVCGGIAEYFDIDANIVRIIWLIITLASGIAPGIVVYVVSAFLIPKRNNNA